MKLTAKQRLFADEYIKSGNATQAYIKAGYKVRSDKVAGVNATRMLGNARVKSYINAKMAEIESHKIADAKEVLQYLTRVLRGEETEEVPDNVNGGVVERKPLIRDRTAAAREIMKRYPLSDPVVQAQLRKLDADTRISEARAKSLEDGGQDVTEAVGSFISLLKEGVDQNHEDQSKQSSDS